MAAARTGFWGLLTRFDRGRLAFGMALRNTVAVAIPLAIGIAANNPAGGVMAATGALNVAFSDGEDPYPKRARRMIAAAVLVALAVFAGRLCGQNHAAAIAMEAACAFAAGLLVAVGQTHGDIGAITLVTLIVFLASPASLGKALSSGLLALGGGLLQIAASLALWTVRRYAPESAAVANLYRELAAGATQFGPTTESPLATEAISTARDALTGLATDRSLQADRYLALFSQAERIRLSLLLLWRFRQRAAREAGGKDVAKLLDACLASTAATLHTIAAAIDGGETAPPAPQFPELPGDAGVTLQALAGQLRSAAELAHHTTRGGRIEFDREQSARPLVLRLAGTVSVLRANLTVESAALRHGVRLAVCVAIADLAARSFGWQRHYWAPMTVAILLKPDFTSTYSRGVLRLAGTFAGLGIATLLSHTLAPAPVVEGALIVIFMFLMRWMGGANYGLLVMPLSALVVFLFALTGVPPAEVVAARALNTVAGGIIALTAYRLWPTWERTHISESLAALFDAYREYFHALRECYQRGAATGDFSRVRQAGRLARTNLEASVARFATEPGADPVRLSILETILANSHRFVHAAMALEAGLQRSSPVPARPAFGEFADATGATLYFLSAYLRGTHAEPGDLPDLRTLHRKLIESGDRAVDRHALVNIETDRITNSLNSLALEVSHWVAADPHPTVS